MLVVNKIMVNIHIKGPVVFHVISGEIQKSPHLTKLPLTICLPILSDQHSDAIVTDLHYNQYLQGEGAPECCSHIDDT